ncbi:MAG: hypothetical protein COB53_02410 [Elusimicrobia bacterium]|nr:MAG: hypothetical protein COB53_02410 [Elusimicrobiota bacterium]
MMKKILLQFPVQKSIASALVAALLMTTPGLGVYEAAAKIVGNTSVTTIPSGFNAPVGLGHIFGLGTTKAEAFLKVDSLGSTLTVIDAPVFLPEQTLAVASAAKSDPRSSVPTIAISPAGIKIAARILTSHAPAIRAPRVTAKQTLTTTVEAVRHESTSGRVSGAPLTRLFDFSRRSRDSNVPAVRGSYFGSRGSRLSRSAEAAVNAADEPASPSSTKEKAVKKGPSNTLVIGLAAAGAVASFYFAPVILAAAATALTFAGLSTPLWITSGSLWTTLGVSALGVVVGSAVSQYPLWLSFPRDVIQSATNAGANTFKFWARFGRILDSVLTGRSTEDANKADLPANIFKYPVLAWPFFLTGLGVVPIVMATGAVALGWPVLTVWGIGAALIFGGAPVFFAAGLLYKVVETPIRAALRGLKQVAFQFFPWLIDFFNFLGRVLRKLFPFIGGGLWGIVRTAGFGIAAGFLTTARPIWEGVADSEIAEPDLQKRDRLYSIPRKVGIIAVRIAGGLTALVAGVLGAGIGLVLSLPFMLVHPLHIALDWAKIETGTIAGFTKRFHDNLDDEEGLGELAQTEFEAAGDQRSISLAHAVARLANAPLHAGYLSVALIATALTAYFRTWSRSLGWTTRPERVTAEPLDGVKEIRDADSKRISAAPENPHFWAPFLLGTLGALGGSAAVYTTVLGGALSLAWLPLALLALGTAAGGFIGLAISQPAAWSNLFGGIKKEAVDGATASYRASARLGLRTDAALRDRAVSEHLYRNAPANLLQYPWLALPGVIVGYVAAVFGFIAGPIAVVVGTATQAAWTGFLSLVERFIPALKRVLKRIVKILRNAIPFAGGLIWGTIRGLFITGVASAAVAAGPIFDAVFDKDLDIDESRYDMDGISKIIAVRAFQLVAVIGLLTAALLGFVTGLIYGLPYTAVFALGKAFDWGNVGGKSENFFRLWEKESLRDEDVRFEQLVRSGFSEDEKNISLWQGIARLGNTLGAAAITPLTSIPIAVSVFFRTIYRAGRAARDREPGVSTYEFASDLETALNRHEGFVRAYQGRRRGTVETVFTSESSYRRALAEGLIRSRMKGFDIEIIYEDAEGVDGDDLKRARGSLDEEADSVQEKKADDLSGAGAGAGVAAVLGLLGAVAAGYAGFAFALPLLGLTGWSWLLGLAGSALIGAGIGFAISQPSILRQWPHAIGSAMRDGVDAAWKFWTGYAGRYAMTLKGDRVPAASTLGTVHYVGGVVGAVGTGIAGFIYGLVSVPLEASLVGAHKVALGLWPWLKGVFKTIARVARRFFPFVFGGIVGLVVGVFGTALFGALLLGRPWFKYVVAEDYDTDTTGKFLGTTALRIVASIIGVIAGLAGGAVFFAVPAAIGFYAFGTWGITLGLAAALPYSLTLSAALAFWMGDIGGRAQRFFDLWAKSALRIELHRMNKLTDSMEFNEKRTNGEIQPADGWIRLANVFAGTLAAAIAGIVASLVTYPRSLFRAGKDLSAGKTLDGSQGFDDFSPIYDSRSGRKVFNKIAAGISLASGIVFSIWMLGWGPYGLLTALWKAAVIVALAYPVGWVAGWVLGLIAGFAIGAVVWLSRQLAKTPPQAK